MKARTFVVLVWVFGSINTASADEIKQSRFARGAIPPKDLEVRVSQQESSGVILAAIRKERPRPAFCKSTDKKFDWREKKKVTDIQDQKACGSCWAFAAVAAYESSHLIENNVTVGASEQRALDCAFKSYSCKGGWHDKVLDMFVDPGDAERNLYPYRAQKGACESTKPVKFEADTWGYVKGASIPSDAELKQALCEYGPIVAAVNAEGWENYTKTDANGKPNPLWATFKNGVFPGQPSKRNLTARNLKDGDVDHDVLVVGWDDELGVWIIKNSWGRDWGEAGYMKLPYGRNNLGFSAAWVRATNVKQPLSPATVSEIQLINAKMIAIKNSTEKGM
jgi:C1A family cysteine protease